MGWCDIHNGRRGIIEILNQLLVHVGIIGHREARLHGVKVVLGLDLRRGQSHHCAATNAMQGNLLGAHRDVVQTVDEQRAPGVDDRRSYIHR